MSSICYQESLLILFINSFISSLQTLVAADTQVNVSRSLSKMKSVFVSLDKDFVDGTERESFYNKQFNNFYSPMAGNEITEVTTHNGTHEIEKLQLQIGSKLYPEFPIRSHAEAFYSLRKAIGIQSNHLHSVDITGNEYRNNKFIVGFDTEKLLGLSFTGTNTKNSMMTVLLKTNSASTHAPSRMHIVMMAEQILEISDTSCSVYD